MYIACCADHETWQKDCEPCCQAWINEYPDAHPYDPHCYDCFTLADDLRRYMHSLVHHHHLDPVFDADDIEEAAWARTEYKWDWDIEVLWRLLAEAEATPTFKMEMYRYYDAASNRPAVVG